MRRLAGLGAAALLLLAALPAASPAATRTITLSGSTSAGVVAADLAYFYRREARNPPRFSLVGGGTDTGAADAARGIVDAGLMSRDLDADDPAGLVFTPFALSGVCLVTNVANPLPNLTRAQIQELVAGRLTAWPQLPGSPRTDALAAAALDVTTGARSVFLSVFVDVATQLAYRPRTFNTAAQVRDYVSATPAAWGYVDLAYARGLHAVPFEGVPCTRATVVSGAYPARRPLGFVTRGRPRGALARFLRWIASDATARRVIATRYVVP
jgi:phosphate transport system substrate-binding protein